MCEMLYVLRAQVEYLRPNIIQIIMRNLLLLNLSSKEQSFQLALVQIDTCIKT